MSHITHFYHLAALDYLDVSGAIVAGTSPWDPQHLNWDSIGNVTGTNAVTTILVNHYILALQIRREAHIAAAEIDGKHPCQNAQVPGGMTTKPSNVNWPNVVMLVNRIRNFINTIYIPDVLSAALCFATPGLVTPGTIAGVYPLVAVGIPNALKYSGLLQGYGCGNLLAYGAFPLLPTTARLFDGATATIGPPLAGSVSAGFPIDETLILEDTTSGFYSSPNNLHPSVGETTPDMTGAGKYTWHKAPRYRLNGVVTGPFVAHEVGPLARMAAQVLSGNTVTVTDVDITAIPGDTLSILPSPGPLTYTAGGLVTTVLTYLQNAVAGLPGFPLGAWLTPDYSLLMSSLGRHAARALECKYLADALLGNAAAVYGPDNPTASGIPLINNVIMDPAPGSEVYTYQVMPKAFKMGRGLTEAPRGALGHWITSEFRRIVNYQAVVPSTWNASGRSAGGVLGPIEASLTGLYTGYVGDGGVVAPDPATTEDVMINRLLRAIHPFDICVACSVHMTDTKGNTITKFRMEPDGRITKEEVKEVPVEA